MRAVSGKPSPRVLALGIGCERGCSAGEIAALADATLAQAGFEIGSVAAVVSIELKRAEPGILALAASLGAPVWFFTAARLLAETGRLSERSAAVFRATGCWGVAEGAALAACGSDGVLLVPKRRSRRATCAVAQASAPIDVAALARAAHVDTAGQAVVGGKPRPPGASRTRLSPHLPRRPPALTLPAAGHFCGSAGCPSRQSRGGPARRHAATEGTRHGAVAAWLFACCALIFAMVVVGGITRLTLSGLSITEWNPVIGVVPPLTEAQWATEFARYQQIPEYRLIHYGMSLAEFKGIYFWEYAHRLLGRLIGVAYAAPLVWFWLRGRLPRRLVPALLGILALGFCQGLLGWYMVESGLVHRVEVSQYRLVAHLALALAIYSLILWVALGLARGRRACRSVAPHLPHPLAGRMRWRRAAEAVILLVGLTIAAGGFVAGTRAGLTYNTFPLMDGRLVPAGYAQLHPFIRNWFENIPTIQFDHRLLAMTTAAAVLLLWAAGLRAALPAPTRVALWALLAAAAVQVALGISTLLYVVPIPLAAAHQADAVILLTAAIVLRHTLRRPAVIDVAARATI